MNPFRQPVRKPVILCQVCQAEKRYTEGEIGRFRQNVATEWEALAAAHCTYAPPTEAKCAERCIAMKLLVVIDLFIVLAFVIKVMFLRARAEGFRKAQQQAEDGAGEQSAVSGFVRFLAIIGFLAVCAMCFYTGVAVLALDR